MRVVALVFALTLLSSGVAAQDMTKQCGSHPGLLRNEAGSLGWFSSSQLHSMALKQGMQALAEFQKIQDSRGVVVNCWAGALARGLPGGRSRR